MTAAAAAGPGQLEGFKAITVYALAGNSILTLVSVKTGTRFTYKIRRAKGEEDGRPWFVQVLAGPNNETDWRYLGTLFRKPAAMAYFHGKKSRIKATAPSAKAIRWFLQGLFGPNPAGVLDQVEIHHDGRCGRCRRLLTDPESVATGLGPICAGKEGLHLVA